MKKVFTVTYDSAVATSRGDGTWDLTVTKGDKSVTTWVSQEVIDMFENAENR